MSLLIKKLLSSRILLRALNVSIRGGTALGRSVLIIFLAKFLPASELGEFGLFVATVLICTLLTSFDFNKYMYRELFAHGSDGRARILGSHVKTIGCLFLLSAPLFYFVFLYGLIPGEDVLYFYSILLLVLVSLELEALLTVLGKQLLASAVFFTQTSLWVFFVIPVIYFFPAYRNLEFIYISWIGGASLSIFIALFFLKSSDVKVSFDGMGADWIIKGLKQSSIFLLSSLMLKLLLTIDRFAVEFHSTTELVGSYVFYISVVMGVYNFLEPGVFSFIYPKLLRSYKENDHAGYMAAHKELIFSTFAGVLVLAISLSYLVPYIVDVLELTAHRKSLDSLWLMILAGAMYMLGYIPHYVLYSRGQFNWLSYANAAALVAFVMSAYLLSMQSPISLVASSLLIAFSVGGCVKACAAYLLHDRQVDNV
ncbi:lipopolysaccharide biosynthesis protein [Pseudomonas sp. GZD-222]|uniref:lipopolysaccharide biosynthesis protein n=1 Tax=Pseudomonas sp. GZD-222 TaxID=3404805 RepID=UPI003BB551AB